VRRFIESINIQIKDVNKAAVKEKYGWGGMSRGSRSAADTAVCSPLLSSTSMSSKSLTPPFRGLGGDGGWSQAISRISLENV